MEDIEETFHSKEIESLLSNLWDAMKNVPTSPFNEFGLW